MKWTMKDGRNIPVDDMKPDHLLNTVNMLIKRHGYRLILKLILRGFQAYKDDERRRAKKKEIKPNGDMAQQFNDAKQSGDIEPYAEDHLWK